MRAPSTQAEIERYYWRAVTDGRHPLPLTRLERWGYRLTGRIPVAVARHLGSAYRR